MERSFAAKGRRLAAIGIGLSLALAISPLAGNATGTDGSDTVRSLYATLLTVMQNGAALGARGRYQQIAPTVERSFDLPFMTRLAVGPEWQTLSAAQRAQVAQAFERYIAAVYADRFDRYSGERLQVTGVASSAGGPIITSQIVKANGEPVTVNYLMHDNGGAWQIADVYLDGTISELATRRSEFAAILRTSGISGLIDTLNTKTARLTGAS
jgi:phospholipid transport system substrate-binding protein